MAKIPSSIIGVDIGRHALKSVSLQRKGANRFILNNYAVRVMDKTPETSSELAAELDLLLKDLGAGTRNCAVGVSSSDSLIRIIDQPETPTDILRDALRLNGMVLLNQDVKDFVLDCDVIQRADSEPTAQEDGSPASKTVRYLVCGLPRASVTELDESFQEYRKNSIYNVQLASVCTFNAFKFSNPETFANQAFVLVDLGHTSSTVTVGVKGELMLVRAIDFGGKSITDALESYGAENGLTALHQLKAEDETSIDAVRSAASILTREISSSIGFFEGRREETIGTVFISGGMAHSKAFLKILSEELQIPCEAWDPFKTCEVALPANRKLLLAEDFVSLNVACGAAAEALKGN